MFKIFYDDAQCIPDLGDICDLPVVAVVCREVGEGRQWTGYDLGMGSDRGLVSLKVQVEEMGRA